MYLSEQEQQEINGLVAEVEAVSGAQFVVAVIGKADAYPEIPWKAFSLGVAAAGLVIALTGFLGTDWAPLNAIVFALVIVLASGMTCAVTTIFMPAIARLLLDRLRAAVEVEQYARALFLEREMFQTLHRLGVLILISLFERRAAIVADVGIRKHLTEGEIDGVVAQMVPLLAAGRVSSAAETGLRMVARLLQGRLDRSATANALADAVIEERGS